MPKDELGNPALDKKLKKLSKNKADDDGVPPLTGSPPAREAIKEKMRRKKDRKKRDELIENATEQSGTQSYTQSDTIDDEIEENNDMPHSDDTEYVENTGQKIAKVRVPSDYIEPPSSKGKGKFIKMFSRTWFVDWVIDSLIKKFSRYMGLTQSEFVRRSVAFYVQHLSMLGVNPDTDSKYKGN